MKKKQRISFPDNIKLPLYILRYAALATKVIADTPNIENVRVW